MRKAVKGLVASGIATTLLCGGLVINDLDNKLEDAINTVNRLEQKVTVQEEQMTILQTDKVKLIEDKQKLSEDNQKLSDEKTKITEEKNTEINRLKKELDDIKQNYVNVTASAYVSTCTEGCSGITATGVNVRNSIYYQGMRVIATDKHVIPMNSIVEMYFADGTKQKAIAIDTGGAIKGKKVDLLVNSTAEAIKFGKQDVTIRVLKWGA